MHAYVIFLISMSAFIAAACGRALKFTGYYGHIAKIYEESLQGPELTAPR